MKALLFILLLGFNHLWAEFDHGLNHTSGSKIQRLKICGERCSGTNFIQYLLLWNFSELENVPALEFGHKHFLWWFGTPLDHYQLARLRYHEDAVDLQGSGDCLFVVVVRDPYDWLRSFYEMPWYVHKSLRRSFKTFVTSEWKLGDRFLKYDGIFSEIDHFNPWTRCPFKNVLDLRKYKMINYFAMSTMVDHYLIVRYEDVRDDPKGFVQYVADHYGLIINESYTPVTTHKGTSRPYVPKKYFPIESRILGFINSEIDWDVEANIGYHLQLEVK